MTAAEKIKEMGIVYPVVVLEDEGCMQSAGEGTLRRRASLCGGDIRTAAARNPSTHAEGISKEMFVGAGTVLTTRQVDEAIEAGARFIVSPGLIGDRGFCIEQIPVFQGCVTASELARAVKQGLEVVKFFPADTSGTGSNQSTGGSRMWGMKFMP